MCVLCNFSQQPRDQEQVNWILPTPRHIWGPAPANGDVVALDGEMVPVRPPPGTFSSTGTEITGAMSALLWLQKSYQNVSVLHQK